MGADIWENFDGAQLMQKFSVIMLDGNMFYFKK
jgi:hypothetical protein